MEVITAVLASPITLMALGVIVKFMPGVREMISNRIIPTLNIAVALIGSLIALATGAAGAPVPPDAVPGVVTSLNDFNQHVLGLADVHPATAVTKAAGVAFPDATAVVPASNLEM